MLLKTLFNPSSLLSTQPGSVVYWRYPVCSRNSPQQCLYPPKSEWHDGQIRINEVGKYILGKHSLLDEITSWCSLWRDDHSGILIGAGGTRRPDWRERVLANDVSRRIVPLSAAKNNRLHACRHKWRVAATVPFNYDPDMDKANTPNKIQAMGWQHM